MSARISDSYRDLNAELHASSRKYGSHGHRWAGRVSSFLEEGYSVLDYGCGKGMLRQVCGTSICEYDPAIPGKDSEPEAADLVVCTDVLEHIEPEKLDNVLEHLASLTRRRLLFNIATKPAKNHLLPDGRNPHLIVRDAEWWRATIERYFRPIEWNVVTNYVHGEALPLLKQIDNIISFPAMSDDIRNEHVKRNCMTVSSRLSDNVAPHDRLASLVCFGPSLKQSYQLLHGDVFCVGAAHSFLIDHGIIPIASIDCDPRSRVVDQLGTPHPEVSYWLASCINPAYIKKLDGCDVALFHLHNGDNSANFVWDIEPDAWLLNGGGSVGLRAISLLYAQGYRRFEIHGMDSSYADDKEYAGDHTGPEKKNIIRVRCRKRWFKTNPQLIDYARQFITDLPLLWPNAEIRLHGDGLLQEMCRA